MREYELIISKNNVRGRVQVYLHEITTLYELVVRLLGDCGFTDGLGVHPHGNYTKNRTMAYNVVQRRTTRQFFEFFIVHGRFWTKYGSRGE